MFPFKPFFLKIMSFFSFLLKNLTRSLGKTRAPVSEKAWSILQGACLGYLQVPDLSLSFPTKFIAKSPKCFFIMFLFIWGEVSCSFLIFEVQILLVHIFQGIHQIMKLDF